MSTATTTGTIPATSDTARRTDPMRKVALAGGIAYLVTFAASIPQLILFKDLVDDPTGYVSNPGSNTAIQLGSVLEVVTAASSVATAVFLYPAVRRVSRTAAVGYVASRVVEAAMIMVGVVSVLAVITLQHKYAGATGSEATSVGVTGEGLVATRQATFLLGPGILPAINAMFLGYAVWRGRLVPRALPAIGFVGAPLLLISTTATIFGGWDQVSGPALLLALPIATWEFSVGVYLTVKGFKTDPRASRPTV